MLPRKSNLIAQVREFLRVANGNWRPIRVALTTATPTSEGRLGLLLGAAPGATAVKTAEDEASVLSLVEALSFSSPSAPQPLAAMQAALTNPADGGVARWLDPTRFLKVFLVSARDDTSPGTIAESLAPFRAALRTKTYADPLLGSTVSVVIAENSPDCDGSAMASGRLADAAWATGGTTFSLCDSQWGQRLMFEIRINDLVVNTEQCLAQKRFVDGELVVTVNGEVWPSVLPGYDPLWTYSPGTNCVRFGDWAAVGGPHIETLSFDYTAEQRCGTSP
jgi:hypothetical protein